MSDKTISFVKKALDYSKANPQFKPPYTDFDELELDLAAYEDLLEIYRKVESLSSQISDTMILCGSEAFVACLSFYNSVKMGVKMNISAAKPIYEDLKTRFPGRQKTITTE